jgi:hypothetical protein
MDKLVWVGAKGVRLHFGAFSFIHLTSRLLIEAVPRGILFPVSMESNQLWKGAGVGSQ